MYSSVRIYFLNFSKPFENLIRFMYLDIKGFVTIGIGQKIESAADAQRYPFQFKTTKQPAGKDLIADEYQRISGDETLRTAGAPGAEKKTKLELTDSKVKDLAEKRLNDIDEYIRKKMTFFKDFDSYPADAQLALLSMAWAGGPEVLRQFKDLCKGCQEQDFSLAAGNCKLKEWGMINGVMTDLGTSKRNAANKRMFENAAALLAGNPTDSVKALLIYPATPPPPVDPETALREWAHGWVEVK